jgi:transposase InsO family protein
VQYVSIEYTERLAEAGIEPSVGSVGDSYVARIRESERLAVETADLASAWERTLHARRRAAQVQWLIAELDWLYFQLLSLRENQLLRHTIWSNRFQQYSRRSRFHARARGSRDVALAETINGLYKAEIIHRRGP